MIAYKEWGKTLFMNTSLTLIANKLKMTKAALYRYFDSKEKIIEEMKIVYLKRIQQIACDFFNTDMNDSPRKIIENFIQIHFGFFINNLSYFFFFLIYLKEKVVIENPHYEEIIQKENEKFAKIMRQVGIDCDLLLARHYLRLIYTTGIYVIIYSLKQKGFSQKRIFNEEECSNILDLIKKIVLFGFGTVLVKKKVPFAEIEKQASLQKEGLTASSDDRIFAAIEKAVAKKGFWNASISMIAKELGMQKSSLYYYFKCKDEMIMEMFKREIEIKNELIQKKLENYHNFADKIYACMIVEASYFLMNPKMLQVFQWFHFQILKFKFKKLEPGIMAEPYVFMQKAIKEGVLCSYSLDNAAISFYLHMLIIIEIMGMELKGYKFSFENIRFVYNYFMYGIIGEKHEK